MTEKLFTGTLNNNQNKKNTLLYVQNRQTLNEPLHEKTCFCIYENAQLISAFVCAK